MPHRLRALLLLIVPLLLANGSCQPGSWGGSDSSGTDAGLTSHDDGPMDCAPARRLSCGDVVSADNGDWNSGATDVLDFYGVAIGNYAGPELVFEFVASADETVSLELVDAQPSVINHDLFVLEGACRADAATVRGFNSLSFEAERGQTYYLVVDGSQGDVGAFEAKLDCTGAGDEIDLIGDLPDPFEPQPDTDAGLVNVSASLEELLEYGALDGACDRWSGDPNDREDMLLCGKELFFYEGFDAPGMPAAIFDFMGTRFPDTVGDGFSSYGTVPDPYADDGRALGYVEGAQLAGHDTVAWGCASCHFGQMPDGRYAVGFPNLELDYGAMSIALTLAPLAVAPNFDASQHHPDALDLARDVIEDVQGNLWRRAQFLGTLLPLMGLQDQVPTITAEHERQYAAWGPGVLDAVLAPAPIDDGVEAPVRILDLWSVPTPEDLQRYQMDAPLLSWSGDAPDLHLFIETFVSVSGGDHAVWSIDRFDPLVEYIRSLRAPSSMVAVSPADAAMGREVFTDAGCESCHDGPRGQGRDTVEYADVGTDSAYMRFGDPDLSGAPCCGLGDPTDVGAMGHALKPPRLTGLWAKDKLLHTGAVRGLDELLCLDGPRQARGGFGYSNEGHEFGCETLSVEEKEQLIAFLLSL